MLLYREIAHWANPWQQTNLSPTSNHTLIFEAQAHINQSHHNGYDPYTSQQRHLLPDCGSCLRPERCKNNEATSTYRQAYGACWRTGNFRVLTTDAVRLLTNLPCFDKIKGDFSGYSRIEKVETRLNEFFSHPLYAGAVIMAMFMDLRTSVFKVVLILSRVYMMCRLFRGINSLRVIVSRGERANYP